MAQTRKQRQKSQRDLRARIERQVRAEVTAEMEARALEAAKQVVCAQRNSVFGQTTEHEYLPVIQEGVLREQCTICDQRRPAEFPTDPARRRAYLELVRTPQQFGQIVAERMMMRQAEKGADFMAGLTPAFSGPDPHGRGAQAVRPQGIIDFGDGNLINAELAQARTYRAVTESALDAVMLHGQGQVVDGPPGLKGASINKMIFDEAVPPGQAFAFSQAAIDSILAAPPAMTITFDSDDDKDSFRNLFALGGGLPVVPSDLAARMNINPA